MYIGLWCQTEGVERTTVAPRGNTVSISKSLSSDSVRSTAELQLKQELLWPEMHVGGRRRTVKRVSHPSQNGSQALGYMLAHAADTACVEGASIDRREKAEKAV